MSELSIAVDVGGTFTDVLLTRLESGDTWTVKTPTTPADPSVGFLAGIDQVLERSGVTPSDTCRVIHGTTIATNAILESKGAMTGLVTTHGFRYVLEIGRQDAPRWVNLLSWQKPRRPVPPENICEILGRIGPDGSELQPLDEDSCRRAARAFKSNGIRSIAICFLHSYANSAHEERARQVMSQEHPDAWFSISSEVLPVFREYERTMATVLNSYVTPVLNRYIANLRRGLGQRSIRAPLYVMKSNGGVVGAQTVLKQPAFTALSGPAAGVIGAAEVAKTAGFDGLISIDVGGTSADVCLIRRHTADVTTEGSIGGWPFSAPMVDIHTVGAGGGSLASVTASGNLIVGPASAGADPGPACYRRGGERPCVTDANAVLGRLPTGLVGGGLVLDVDAARRAIKRHVADPLGIDVVTAAAGIVDIINNNMVGAIRVITVERGVDPRDLTLFPFGGAGPLHGASVARLLGCSSVLIGRTPGVLSAQGLLLSEVRNDFARACTIRNPAREDVSSILKSLDEEAREWLRAEGVPEIAQLIRWQADLRYPNQAFELTVDIDRDGDATDPSRLYDTFHDEHERFYTYRLSDSSVELVTLRASAIGTLATAGSRVEPHPAETFGDIPKPIGQQTVYFTEVGDFVACRIYDRLSLLPGLRLTGPALVMQMDTTTLILPRQHVRVDRIGNLIISDDTEIR